MNTILFMQCKPEIKVNSVVEAKKKKKVFQNILNNSEQREKIKANQSTLFFVLFNWFLKTLVTIVTPVGLLITKFVKRINYSELLGGKNGSRKPTTASIANKAWQTSH